MTERVRVGVRSLNYTFEMALAKCFGDSLVNMSLFCCRMERENLGAMMRTVKKRMRSKNKKGIVLTDVFASDVCHTGFDVTDLS